jgi:hypothetical protein
MRAAPWMFWRRRWWRRSWLWIEAFTWGLILGVALVGSWLCYLAGAIIF